MSSASDCWGGREASEPLRSRSVASGSSSVASWRRSQLLLADEPETVEEHRGVIAGIARDVDAARSGPATTSFESRRSLFPSIARFG